ncbi:hypothetical protein TTHT_1881 [Thermotomaculum hydrothermale]|uniref:Lipoprotein n=1 Tax=Thermotomaculum hydrothermale TaxID=981385 RepID=A0A7R6PNI4_9BACT|nr:hypothetical protein [Thermotomaculum hydrothermale]BBB33337.1 hypothetical protein TTHT_1881 [Thermotomaculum hydrothermale]
MKKLFSFVLILTLLTSSCSWFEKQQVKKMEQMAMKIDKLNDELKQKEEAYRQLLSEYGLKGDKKLTPEQMRMLALTPEQRAYLKKRLAQEKDSSYSAIIQEILNKDEEIKQLRKEIQELKDKLPKPYVVQPGDNHYDICMKFLTEQKGLTPEEAQKLVERVNLLEYLLPGFEVYLFYDNGVFGTFVIQGTADMSPNQIKRYYKTKLINERDKARQEAEKLSAEVKDLEARKAELLAQLRELEQLKADMQNQISKLTSKNKALSQENLKKEKMLNSVFYHVDNYKALKKKGIVGRFLFGKPKLKKFNAVKFDKSADLREVDSITVNAEDAGLVKISGIYIMPSHFIKDKDYQIKISPDKKSATIFLINPDKFRMSKVLIAVR